MCIEGRPKRSDAYRRTCTHRQRKRTPLSCGERELVPGSSVRLSAYVAGRRHGDERGRIQRTKRRIEQDAYVSQGKHKRKWGRLRGKNEEECRTDSTTGEGKDALCSLAQEGGEGRRDVQARLSKRYNNTHAQSLLPPPFPLPSHTHTHAVVVSTERGRIAPPLGRRSFLQGWWVRWGRCVASGLSGAGV